MVKFDWVSVCVLLVGCYCWFEGFCGGEWRW